MYNAASLFEAIPLDSMVSLGFFFASSVYIIFSGILYYHWKEYSVEPIVSKLTALVYLSTTLPLIVIMGIVTLII